MMMSRTPEPGTPGTAPALSRPLPRTVSVVNVGLALLGDAVRAQQAEVVDVRWQIPALGKEALVRSLTSLLGPQAERIDQANQEVLRRLDEGSPQFTRIGSALGELPGMTSRTILHCGPPLPWAQFSDPLRRSVLAAITAEGMAASPAEAGALVERGEIARSQPIITTPFSRWRRHSGRQRRLSWPRTRQAATGPTRASTRGRKHGLVRGRWPRRRAAAAIPARRRCAGAE